MTDVLNCSICRDSGFEVTESGARRCQCRTKQAEIYTNYTPADLEHAMRQLGMLTFFPVDPATRGEIKALLMRLIPHREALRWLVTQLVDNVGRWPGPSELRALLDCRYRPRDGKPGGNCSLAGYTPAENEARYHQALPPLDAPLSIEAKSMLKQLAAGKGMG